MPTKPTCPSCGSTVLKLNESGNHAQCSECLFFCHVAPDGTTTEDRDTVLDTTKWTIDDMLAHPATLRVLSRRMAEHFGVRVSDEVIETAANHLIQSQLPKPSGSTLA